MSDARPRAFFLAQLYAPLQPAEATSSTNLFTPCHPTLKPQASQASHETTKPLYTPCPKSFFPDNFCYQGADEVWLWLLVMSSSWAKGRWKARRCKPVCWGSKGGKISHHTHTWWCRAVRSVLEFRLLNLPVVSALLKTCQAAMGGSSQTVDLK